MNAIVPIIIHTFYPNRLKTVHALLKGNTLEGNLLHTAINHSVMKTVENINRVIPHHTLRASCLTNDLS